MSFCLRCYPIFALLLLSSLSGASGLALKYFKQGKAYERVGNLDSAYYYYTIAYRENQSDPGILEALASAESAIGKKYEAATHFRLLLKLKPNSIPAHYFLGHYNVMRRRHESAILHLRKYLELSKKRDTESILTLAEELSLDGKSGEAASLLKRYQSSNPGLKRECASAYANGTLEAAANCYKKLFHIELYSPETLLFLARIYDLGKRERERHATARRLFLLFGTEVKYAWPYAFYLYEKKKYQKAKNIFMRILLQSPDSRLAKDMLENIELEMGHS